MIELVIRFQWVKCQLDALGRCLSLSSLRKALRSLPKDLDDTYARILQSIEDGEHSKLVATIVQWLAYSKRPMTLREISEALTIDPDDDHQFDIERRLENPQDLLRICSSLVTTVPRRGEHWTSPGSGELLQFAHFSVREYLESSRIHDGPAERYAIQEIHSNTFIAESCIIYLHHLDVAQQFTDDDYYAFLRKEHPCALYAISYWADHAERAEEGGNIIALSKAFSREAYKPPRWEICRNTCIIRGSHECFDFRGKYLPLLYASMYNIPKITSALILEGADVNAADQSSWTPLMKMSQHQHERIELVQLLLKHGANINARTEHGGTALMLAASRGKLQTVRMLLDYGANPHAHDDNVGDTALTLATREGHSRVVDHLFDRGQSISARPAVVALQIACLYRRHETLRILLSRGVDVDATCHQPRVLIGFKRPLPFTTPLLRTDFHSESGPKPHAHSTIKGFSGVALELALNYGEDSTVELLLEYGAKSSLVRPKLLNEDGMRCFQDMLRKISRLKIDLCKCKD